MLSSQAREFYKFIIEQLQGFKGDMDNLFQFTEAMKKQQDDLLSKILNEQNKHNARQGQMHAVDSYISAYNREIANFKNNFDMMDFPLAYTALTSTIQNYIMAESINAPEINAFIASFDTLKNKVQFFLKNDSDVNARIDFHTISSDICNNFHKIIDSYSWFIENLEEQPHCFDDTKDMLLDIKLLGVEFSVNEFAEKIQAIDKIYEHISAIIPANDNVEIQPMKIVKIESGSLEFAVIGSQVIAGLIVVIISGIAKEMVNKFKNNKEPLSTKDVESIVKEELEKSGIKADNDNREHIGIIQKKAIEITSKFGTLKINDEVYSYKGNDINALPFNQKLIGTEDNSTPPLVE